MDFTDRIKAIGAEVKRAEVWENKDRGNFLSALERGLELIELSLDNPTDKEEVYPMLVLKEKLGEFYAGQKSGIGKLYAAF